MSVTDDNSGTSLTVTTGNVTIGNAAPWNDYYFYNTWFYGQCQIEPQHCIGRAHVFECDHAKACKCGKVKRSNPAKMEK